MYVFITGFVRMLDTLQYIIMIISQMIIVINVFLYFNDANHTVETLTIIIIMITSQMSIRYLILSSHLNNTIHLHMIDTTTISQLVTIWMSSYMSYTTFSLRQLYYIIKL